MEQFIVYALGIFTAVAGYFLKRWWEGQSLRETLGETIQLANLHKELRTGTVSLAELRELKSDLHKRATSQQSGQEEVLRGIGRAIYERESQVEYEPQSQAEMNRYSFHLENLAEQELKYVVEELMAHFTQSEEKAFQKAQRAWKSYAELQADFESLEAEGGSMQPMLRAAAHRTLIVERAGYIKGEVNKRNQIDI